MFRVFAKFKSGSHSEKGYGKLCKETSNNNRSFSFIHYISVMLCQSFSVESLQEAYLS